MPLVPAMPTRNIVLTDRQDALVDALVESGRYQNASEVLREGLRLIETREAEQAARLSAFRDAVQVGLDDLDAGRYREFKSFDALRKHLDELTDQVLKRRRS